MSVIPTPFPSAELPPFLRPDQNLRLLLFAGKGGVGKTTCATAAAIHLAEQSPSDRFLLVSVDPAHSVGHALAGDSSPTNLEIIELSAAACLDEFLTRHRETLYAIARRGTFLDEEDIRRFVDLSLPGMDELFALLQISTWTRAASYQTVIVDTAPSGHAHRLLEIPQLIQSWIEALDALLAKHRYMVERFRGQYVADQTDQLLHELASAAEQTLQLLTSPGSSLVPVLLAEPLSVAESLRFLSQLREQKVQVGPLLINQRRRTLSCQQCQVIAIQQQQALHAHAAELSQHELWELPLLPVEVRGRSALSSFYLSLRRLTLEPIELAAPATVISCSVSPRLKLPEPRERLLLFAGKGGVGKTTMACATALRLAEEARPIVLLSTDPAHAAPDCLRVQRGSERVSVTSHLSLLAPDAVAQWGKLRQQYEAEIRNAWQHRQGQLQLAFEQRAIERLLDLRPPGLDELMALTEIIELLAQSADTTLVVDTAPTGHLLRLLAMPELLSDWLKAIFAVLLKNKQVLRLPHLTDRLIELSKRLKALRRLLIDHAQTALYVVMIPTQLARSETADLLSACQKLDLEVAAILVNQLTLAQRDSCSLCHAVAAREAELVMQIQQLAGALPVTSIGVQSPPAGVAELQALGRALYTPNKPDDTRGSHGTHH